MKFKSQVYTQVSGSVGGVTYSHGRSGMYARGRGLPTNPNTAYQQAVRSNFALLMSAWLGTLSAAQRAAWEAYAAAVPYVNALGDPVTLTGPQMFVACNSLRLQAGVAQVPAGPVVLARPTFTGPVPTLTAASEGISIAYTTTAGTDDWAREVGGHLLVYQSRPQKATINSFNGPYRYLGKVDGAVSPPSSPAAFTSLWPFEVGERLFFKYRIVRADGRASSPFRGYGTGA